MPHIIIGKKVTQLVCTNQSRFDKSFNVNKTRNDMWCLQDFEDQYDLQSNVPSPVKQFLQLLFRVMSSVDWYKVAVPRFFQNR